MDCIIYKIFTNIDSRIYIGSTINKDKRWKEHKRDLRKGKHSNKHLQNFVYKYGLDTLEFSIIEICMVDNILIREQYYLDTTENLFNIATNSSAPMMGKHHSREAKEKIAKRSRGNNNPMFGVTRSDAVKSSISKAQTNRFKTKEEKLLRLVKLNNRKELLITKNNKIIHCFSYAHASSIIGITAESVSKAIRTKRFKAKGWILSIVSNRLYTENLVMNNIDLFSDNLHPQPELVEMLKNL